ncbi:hypothetical protein Tco_0191087 [Tanacetum coccineum]
MQMAVFNRYKGLALWRYAAHKIAGFASAQSIASLFMRNFSMTDLIADAGDHVSIPTTLSQACRGSSVFDLTGLTSPYAVQQMRIWLDVPQLHGALFLAIVCLLATTLMVSKRQFYSSLSSAEAEYRGVANASGRDLLVAQSFT